MGSGGTKQRDNKSINHSPDPTHRPHNLWVPHAMAPMGWNREVMAGLLVAVVAACVVRPLVIGRLGSSVPTSPLRVITFNVLAHKYTPYTRPDGNRETVEDRDARWEATTALVRHPFFFFFFFF